MSFDWQMSHKGNASVSVGFEFDQKKWYQLERREQIGMIAMADDIAGNAIDRVPVDTGALRNSIRRENPTEDGIQVSAGGGFYAGNDGHTKYIGYAYKREQGPNRNPATEHYMEQGFNATMRTNWQKRFFGGITQ